jgi:hypothetical protein
VIDDDKLAEHLIATFDVLWNESEAEQEPLLHAWENR